MHFEALEPRHLLALMPQLLGDLTPGPDGSSVWSVVDVEETTFFTVEPAELWKTDGTAGGTVLVADLGPGSGRTYLYLHNHNGLLVFAKKDAGPDWSSDDDRVQLWKSDGTTAGTVLIKDFGLGSSWSMSLGAYLTTVDDALFAVVGDLDGGNELWKSDLTESGTVRVKDIRPGAYGSYPGALTNLNGTLYFSAADESHGSELWRSDGTESGTVLVKDIFPGTYGSGPFWLTAVDGELFFSAFDGDHGHELWKSDGTTAGIVMVKDIQPGPGSSGPLGQVLDGYMESLSFVPFDGQVFFFADDGDHGRELWKSDGTEAGTVLVKDIRAGLQDGVGASYLENAGGTLFLSADDGIHGQELWKSDGSESGTVLVADIRPGALGSNPSWLSSAGGKLFFGADDETHGQELWRSDGTEAGTELAADIYPGSASSYPRLFPTTRGQLFLTADDGSHGTEPFVMGIGGEIRGQKFADADGDGRRDPDEPGLDGFAIQLLDAETGDVLQSAVTAGEELDGTPGIDPVTERGLYRFEVAPGTYRIHELLQDGWLQSVPLSGDYLITVQAGQVVGTAPAEAPVSAGPGVNWLDEVDDYQTAFTVPARPAGTVTVSLPDIARGAGQPANVPNASAGLPIRLDNAAGVTSLAVDLRYEQTLLHITAATLAAGVPADWSVTLDTGTPGVAQVTASGTTPLSGTNVDVVRLTAAVPSTAAYGASQAIHLASVSLNSGAIAAVGDVAVHKAAYQGDADGSGIHSSADAFLTVQAALGLAGGFAAHSWTDPRIVGDADASGVLSAADAFLIVQEGLGLSEPFVPDNPHIGITPVGGGVDPQFQIDVNLPASAGGLLIVPVKLAIEPAATNVGALDFDLLFDASRLTIQLPGGVSAGADTAGGWAVSARLIDAGHLRVGMISSGGQPLSPGLREIARLQFHVEAEESSRTGWQPVPRCCHRSPITDYRLPITDHRSVGRVGDPSYGVGHRAFGSAGGRLHLDCHGRQPANRAGAEGSGRRKVDGRRSTGRGSGVRGSLVGDCRGHGSGLALESQFVSCAHLRRTDCQSVPLGLRPLAALGPCGRDIDRSLSKLPNGGQRNAGQRNEMTENSFAQHSLAYQERRPRQRPGLPFRTE